MVAAEVSSLAKVELLPLTLRGSEPRFSAKSPPELTDSAARESDATAPAPSLMMSFVAGSVVFYSQVRCCCLRGYIRSWDPRILPSFPC